MGVLSQSFNLRGGLTDPPTWLREALGMVNQSSTGLTVTPRSAMTFASVYSAVNGISTDVAKMPIEIYKLQKIGKTRAPSHPLDAVLHDLANPDMTAFEVKQIIQGNVLLRGNGYAQILENNAGEIIGLFPLPSSHVTPFRDQDNVLFYRVTTRAGQATLPAREIFHLKIMAGSENPDEGISPITFARESMGLGIAQQEYEGRLYNNDASPGGILTHPGRMRPEGRKALRKSWDESHAGLSRAHKTALLEEGVTWQQVGMKPIDAQFLESRKFQVEEIARWYRYPLHKLFHADRGDHNTVEQDAIQYVNDCLGGWIESWISTIRRDLFMPSERLLYVAVFNTRGLLRGDFATRMNGYAVATDHGWMSSNEVRDAEDMNPIAVKDPETGNSIGENYYRALNMVVQGAPKPKVAPPAPPAPGPGPAPAGDTPLNPAKQEPAVKSLRSLELRGRYQAGYAPLFVLAATRLLATEAEAVMEAAERLLGAGDVDGLTSELTRFYQAHQAAVYERMLPPAMGLAAVTRAEAAEEVNFDGTTMTAEVDGFVRDLVTGYSRRHVKDSEGSLREALRTGADMGVPALDMVRQRLLEWTGRAERIGASESVNVANAVSKATFREGGVTRLTWVRGGPCGYCDQLSGTQVGVADAFLAAGQKLEAPELGPLIAHTNIGHGPLHDGCTCSIAAAI